MAHAIKSVLLLPDLLLSTDFEPLEDLDDAEFCLPSIDFTPSLEEILKEEEDFDEDDDEEEADHGLDVSWASQHRTTGLNCSGQSFLRLQCPGRRDVNIIQAVGANKV